MKSKEEIKNEFKGYSKVNHAVHGGLIEVTLFNPVAKIEKKIIVDDMEYQYMEGFTDKEYPIEFLEYIRYKLKINEKVRKLWLDSKGVVYEGAKVIVYKGRKELNKRGMVEKIFPKYDKYHRFIGDYCKIQLDDSSYIYIRKCNLKLTH